MPLKPHVAAILNAMAEAGRPGLHELSPEEARAGYQNMHADLNKVDLAGVEDSSASGIPIRIYRPSLEPDLPCIVFYHGGGWVIGDLDTHDAPCRMLAKETGAVVIAVDYALSPESKFPGPVDDAYKALCWIAENSDTLNISKNLAVAGDSAGGNLATVMCLKARDQSGPEIKHQLLIYPVTDGAMNSVSYEDNAEGYMLTRDTMKWFFGHYATDTERLNPMVSPCLADSLEDLPPATIFTAEFDPLRDEGEAYAEKLSAAGVRTYAKRFDGQVHGFFTMTDMMPEAAEAVTIAAEQMQPDL